jgi:4-hydroxy-tetrahydrodipicolinate reductase
MERAGYRHRVDMASTRAGANPGTHTIGFDGPFESLTLTHSNRDRAAFAQGALQAAKWIQGKRGWFTIRDVLGLE